MKKSVVCHFNNSLRRTAGGAMPIFDYSKTMFRAFRTEVSIFMDAY